MIDRKSTYNKNIDREENSHYRKMVEGLVNDGKLDDKHRLFLDTDDIVNIITLALLKIKCEEPYDEETIDWSNNYRHIDEISNLFISLPMDIRARVMFSYGLEFSWDFCQVPAFDDAITHIHSKFNAGIAHLKMKYGNIV